MIKPGDLDSRALQAIGLSFASETCFCNGTESQLVMLRELYGTVIIRLESDGANDVQSEIMGTS